MQRAIRGSASDRPARHRDPQSRRFPQSARRHVCRRRSRAGDHRRAGLHPSRPSDPVPGSARLPDVQRRRRGHHRRVGGEGAVQRRPRQRLARQLCDGRLPTANSGRRDRSRSAMPAHTTINGMPADLATAHVNTEFGRDRRQRGRLSVGSAAHLSLRHADPGRKRARPVRAAGELAAENHRERGGGDPAAGSSMS